MDCDGVYNAMECNLLSACDAKLEELRAVGAFVPLGGAREGEGTTPRWAHKVRLLSSGKNTAS